MSMPQIPKDPTGPLKLVGRTEEQERQFLVILGYLATGNSIYDLAEQFVESMSQELDTYYEGVVCDLQSKDINYLHNVGKELAEKRNSVIYG